MPIRIYTAARWNLACLGLVASALTACGQDDATAALRALGVTGETSAVCLARDADGAFTLGRDRADCPDYQTPRGAPGERHLHLLVTQPISGEVALVDLGASLSEAVIDFEPSQPGYSFMPVGADPGSIVSTPGGIASFVGVSETGREGIFGLPSSCIGARPESSPLRDIRTWPACRLPAAPGPMLVLDDPALDDDNDPSTPDRVRARCDSDYVDRQELLGTALAADREVCAADLALERPASGRRKLVVTLPSLAQVWVLDAQELLDRTPGSFEACVPEAMATLGVESLDVEQRLPADLVPSSASCAPVGLNHGPPADAYRPWPEDVALDDEGVLYVADSQAPVIHVLDASNPCTLSTLPSLHPVSYSDPNAVITTRRLDVSTLTTTGQRFVYAIDNSTTRTAGTLMAFDVSPGSTERTPIVRERSPFNPNEPPDRIALPRDVADIQFVTQDNPRSDALGIYVEGISCDPDPTIAPDSIPALYRPRADLSAGAGPTLLRGTYAMAALHSGQLAVIDIEDLDGACRRPVEVNHTAVEDEFGCKNDDPSVPPVPASDRTDGGYQFLGVQTVSNELSCNVVAPHRARSRSFFTNSVGTVKSAGLRAFPTLTLDSGRSVATDQSDEGRDQPKMLGARYVAGAPAELYVGPLQYTTEDQGSPLELDPRLADRSSLLLSYEEPRNFVPAEDFTATYEGVVRTPSRAIFRAPTSDEGYGIVDEGLNASFCNAGVQDMDLSADVGRGLAVPAGAPLATFVRQSADYVQVTADLLEEDDAYWSSAEGSSCGSELYESNVDNPTALLGRPLCDSVFGPANVPLPLPSRDLRIVAATEDQLLVEPREFDPNVNSTQRRKQLMQFLSCCFPGASEFQIRAGRQWVMRGSASGVGHHVTTDPTSRRCVNDCSPLVQKLAGRAFELSCSENCPRDPGQPPAIGLADPTRDFACVVDDTTGGIDPGEPGSECVFQSLTSRLAIYRGQQASRRDMRFRWQFSDGFTPFSFTLTSTERNRSSPRSLLLLPELGQLVVTDGSAPGLTFVAVSSPTLTTTSVY